VEKQQKVLLDRLTLVAVVVDLARALYAMVVPAVPVLWLSVI
jgi:hypothetical protein